MNPERVRRYRELIGSDLVAGEQIDLVLILRGFADDFLMVPVEPAAEMIDAGENCILALSADTTSYARAVWAAMIGVIQNREYDDTRAETQAPHSP